MKKLVLVMLIFVSTFLLSIEKSHANLNLDSPFATSAIPALPFYISVGWGPPWEFLVTDYYVLDYSSNEYLCHDKLLQTFQNLSSLTYNVNSHQVDVVYTGDYAALHQQYPECPGTVSAGSMDVSGNGGSYSFDPSNLVFTTKPILNPDGSVWHGSDLHLLTVNLNPQTGGTVAGMPGVLTCTDGTCTGTFGGNETLTAVPAENYALGYWYDGTMQSTTSPLTITMNSDKTLTANFFRTFHNNVGNFQITTGNECVLYVRAETNILTAACTGEAADCFSQAQAAGYATGQTPKNGAIIVFDRKPNTALSVGHVGIVTGYSEDYTSVSMHDSNWVGYHAIGDHTETIGAGGYAIKGYIYYTPNQP